MDSKSFMTSLEQDLIFQGESRASTNCIDYQTVPSNASASFSVDLNLSSTVTNNFREHQEQRMFALGSKHQTSQQFNQTGFQNEHTTLTSLPTSLINNDLAKRIPQPRTADYTIPEVENMDESDDFDRYTRSAFADMQTKRQTDLDYINDTFSNIVPVFPDPTLFQGTSDCCPQETNSKNLDLNVSDFESQNKIQDVTEHFYQDGPSSSKETSKQRKKKRLAEKDPHHDSFKYKRRKDLSYECAVTDMAEQKDICLRCQVCGGVASGFHYGAETCGACKIFFRRNANKPPRHTCTDTPNRSSYSISCPGCRLEKSIEIGMNTSASRKGRYSYKRRYEYHRRSVQQVQAVQRQLTGQEMIVFTPTKSGEEVVDLANRISDMFLSCGTYSPRFFETLGDIERRFYENKLVNETAYGRIEPLNDERYKHIFVGTGLDIDGRQQAYRQRFLSFERRIRSYVAFAKKLHGFNELPKEDQESMFRYSCPNIACLTEYRACIVKKGIRIHPEGFVENTDDIRELYSEDYVDLLFRVAAKIQAMNYTENERNLLKLIGFFASEFCTTEEGSRLAAKHQDFVIKAFDKLIRINRKDIDCAKVIADSIMILADIREIKEKASTTFNSIVTKFPFLTPSPLVKEIIDIQEESSG